MPQPRRWKRPSVPRWRASLRTAARFFANTVDAQVPKSLAGTVAAVLGLTNISVPIPTPPSLTNLLNGYTPQDFQIAYDAAYPADAPGGNANKQKVTPNCGGARYCSSNLCEPAVGIIVEGSLGTVSPNNPNQWLSFGFLHWRHSRPIPVREKLPFAFGASEPRVWRNTQPRHG